jgi:hypothetical protein
MNCNKHVVDAGQCPLCGQPNECQLCTAAAYKGPCWCAKMEIPETLLAQVPAALRNRACICRACIESFPDKVPGTPNQRRADQRTGLHSAAILPPQN